MHYVIRERSSGRELATAPTQDAALYLVWAEVRAGWALDALLVELVLGDEDLARVFAARV